MSKIKNCKPLFTFLALTLFIFIAFFIAYKIGSYFSKDLASPIKFFVR